jgi:hypothetical protein
MAKDEQLPDMLTLDRDGNRFDATWSKSMKSLIVTVGPPDPSGREWRQVSLDLEQAAQLRDGRPVSPRARTAVAPRRGDG